MPPPLRTSLQFLVLTCALLGQASQSAQANSTPKLVRFRAMPPDVHANSEDHFEGFKRPPMVRFEVDEQGAVHNAKIKRNRGSRVADGIALGSVRRWKVQTTARMLRCQVSGASDDRFHCTARTNP